MTLKIFYRHTWTFHSVFSTGGGDTGKNTPYKTRNKLFHVYDISNKSELITGAKKIAIEDAIDTDYDLIVCSNVLEHAPYPADIIHDIKALMRADSVLYIEIPLEDIVRTCDSDTKLVKKRHWHEHINFFSESSIRALLSNSGLEVIDFKLLQASAGSNTSWQQLIACKLS